MKKITALVLAGMMALSLGGCTKKTTDNTAQKPKEERTMILATTTSTQDSGLLDYLLPQFEKDTGIKVKVVAKGTGAALEIGKNLDADCLLVHAKAQEEQFIKDGYGIERFDVMYNDFLIVGPKDDPAKLKTKAPTDAIAALKLINDAKAQFISRGDGSGTETKEKAIWKSAGITPKGSWYIAAGKGMGEVLQMADEKKAYTLTDRATYLSMKDKLDLQIVTEKGKDLLNQYGVIRLNDPNHKIKEKEADEFITWILSDKIQKFIGEYGVDKYGQQLFIPNAKK
jgi:tungstate transport system substrate-binding protein